MNQFASPATLDRKRHVCAFFNSKDEEYRVLLPFVREGFAVRHRAFHIVDGRHRDEHLARLRGAEIDVEGALADGQLEVRPWEEAYLRDGHFDQERMLALIEEVLQDGQQRGFGITRLVANMEWALEDRPGWTTSSSMRRGSTSCCPSTTTPSAEPTTWPSLVPTSSSTSCAPTRW